MGLASQRATSSSGVMKSRPSSIGHWDTAMLDIPIPGEFVPADPDREMEFLTNNLCWSAGSVATPKKFSLREPKKFLNRLRRQPPANPLQSESTRAISVLYGTIVMRNTQQNSAPINL